MMRTVFESRASTILYRLASATAAEAGPFLIPANVCPVVPLALLAAGRRFEFVDLDAETWFLDETRLLTRLAEHRRDAPAAGVLFVRTYGAELDAEPLFRRIRRVDPETLIIDDRCLSRPLPDRADLDGETADVVLFSTGYSKQVDLGFGGFAHLKLDVPYVERSRPFRTGDLEKTTDLYKAHIRTDRPIYRTSDPNRPETALTRLRWLETATPELDWAEYRRLVLERRHESDRHRDVVNRIYASRIPRSHTLPAPYNGWRFQVRAPEAPLLLSRILESHLFASDHFYPSARLFGDEPCPTATELQRGIVNLFNDFRISESQAENVADLVADHLERCG